MTDPITSVMPALTAAQQIDSLHSFDLLDLAQYTLEGQYSPTASKDLAIMHFTKLRVAGARKRPKLFLSGSLAREPHLLTSQNDRIH